MTKEDLDVATLVDCSLRVVALARSLPKETIRQALVYLEHVAETEPGSIVYVIRAIEREAGI